MKIISVSPLRSFLYLLLNQSLISLMMMGAWLYVFAATDVQASDIECDDQTGAYGTLVSFDVWIVSAPNDVASFGFSVVYDPNVLVYKGYVEGSLVSGFDFFGVNQSASGVVKVGGFCSGGGLQIREMDSGSVVSLQFEVVGHEDCAVYIRGLKDNVQSWTTRSGYFTGDHADNQEPNGDGGGSQDETGSSPVSDGNVPVQSASLAFSAGGESPHTAEQNVTVAETTVPTSPKERSQARGRKKDLNFPEQDPKMSDQLNPTNMRNDQQQKGKDLRGQQGKGEPRKTTPTAQSAVAETLIQPGSVEIWADTQTEISKTGSASKPSQPAGVENSLSLWLFLPAVAAVLLVGCCLFLARKARKK